jgi:hypothetical protein
MQYPFQPGSLSLVVGGAVATLTLAIYGAIDPDRHRMYASLFFVIFGLTGTWRNYLKWQQSRERRLVR